MRFPVITGMIDRRILVNYRVDRDVLQAVLPAPFRVKVVAGYGIGGICLIRLRQMRARFLPGWVGFGSENAAHRFAVEWDAEGGVHEGVYIPRRDTSSWLNHLVGGRLFPGEHHLARFDVQETDDEVAVALRSRDGATRVAVAGAVGPDLPSTSVFPSLAAASAFFERGSIGYSATRRPGCYDCLELRSRGWQVELLDVHEVESSFFADTSAFPPGSVEFDCALLMRRIAHDWVSHAGMVAPA